MSYTAIMTLNGNLVLKPSEKVKETDEVEMEFYGTEAECKAQFKEHKKMLKAEGLL